MTSYIGKLNYTKSSTKGSVVHFNAAVFTMAVTEGTNPKFKKSPFLQESSAAGAT